MAATIRDVAREAGVAVSTVSRALNGSANIAEATRARVLAAAAALRFTPSSAARSLITGRTHAVGVVLPALYGEYFSELIRGIDGAARERGLHLLLSSWHGEAAQAAAALRALHGRVDGVLLMSLHADARSAYAALLADVSPELPTVLLGSRPRVGPHASFTLDNFGGARAMTRHLLGAGRRRVAFVAGPADNHEAAERLRGYRAALAEANARECVLEGDFGEASGREAGRRIAAMARRPDAVFAASDMMAIGVLGALADAGLRVPADVALAGFDDSALARHVRPALTTVRVHVAELGALALARLADEIGGPRRKPVHRTVAAEIVVRASCGASLPAAAAA
ncbi:MAG TPA: LacI family DNA-binding transcriptional regulator [Burkholderiaceae bacterium]